MAAAFREKSNICFDVAHIDKMDTPSTRSFSKTYRLSYASGGVVNTHMHFLCEVVQNPGTLGGTHMMVTNIQSSKSHVTTWEQECVVWTSTKHPTGDSKGLFQYLREK